MIARRGLIAGLGALLAAPVIVRTPGLLMPIKAARSMNWNAVYCYFPDKAEAQRIAADMLIQQVRTWAPNFVALAQPGEVISEDRWIRAEFVGRGA